MITIYELVSEYFKAHNLPDPSQNDLAHIGKMIGTHFRRFWGIMQPPEVIQQAGFTWSKEPGRSILVLGYPDVFRGEMIARVELFLRQKSERIEKDYQLKNTEKPPSSTTTEPKKKDDEPPNI